MWAKWTKQDELKAGMADLPTSNGSPYHLPPQQQQQGPFEQAFSPVVSSADKQAEYDVAMTTINSQSTAVYSPPLGESPLCRHSDVVSRDPFFRTNRTFTLNGDGRDRTDSLEQARLVLCRRKC